MLCACLHPLNCLPAHTPKGVCVGAVNGSLGSVGWKTWLTWVNSLRINNSREVLVAVSWENMP